MGRFSRASSIVEVPVGWCCHTPVAPDKATDWLKIGLAAVVAGQTMAFGIAVNLSPPEGMARWILHSLLALAVLVVFGLVGFPLVRHSWQAFVQKRLAAEQLFLIGILAAFGASLHSTFTSVGDVYYEVVAVLLAIYTLGAVLRQQRQAGAWEAVRDLRQQFDQCVLRLPDGRLEEVPVREVKPGDLVWVRRGEGVPVDGKICQGSAFVDETALTGETEPVVRREGDIIRAGARVLESDLWIRVERAGTERSLDHFLSRLEEAAARPALIQREADRLVSWFLPLVLTLTILAFGFWTWMEGWQVGLFNALAVLVVACPCAMGLATPLGVWNALNRMATGGLSAWAGEFVEKLAQVDLVVFDKTGTLSQERLVAADLVVMSGVNREELRAAAAALESQSRHPVARALRTWYSPDCPVEVLSFEELPAAGVRGKVVVKGVEHHLVIGNERILSGQDRESLNDLAHQLRVPGVPLYFMWDGKPAAVASLRETLRDSAAQTLQALADIGLEVQVMTGDRPGAAEALGLPAPHSALTPQDKAERVAELEKQGRRVLFVGDGVNDAAAMSMATCSIAMGSGAEVTREVADAQLLGQDLTVVARAIRIARGTLSAIRRNLAFAAFYNFAGISLALSGLLHPVVAAFLMLASSLLVTARSLLIGIREENLPPEPRKAPSTPGAWSSALGRVTVICVALQGPLIAWLGTFPLSWALFFSLASLGAAIWLGLSGWQKLGPVGTFLLAMTAMGNTGMFLGWWIDVDFGPVIRDGVCLCGCPKSPIGGGLIHLSVMQIGMIAASLQCLLLVGANFLRHPGGPPPGWIWHHALCLVAMVGGMELSTMVMALVPMMDPRIMFLLTAVAMTLGMVAGMALTCYIWQRWGWMLFVRLAPRA